MATLTPITRQDPAIEPREPCSDEAVKSLLRENLAVLERHRDRAAVERDYFSAAAERTRARLLELDAVA